MKILTIANLKGGVAKTVTAVNTSYVLASEHGKRVLLVDADQQGNATQFYGRYGYDKPSMSDILTQSKPIKEVIQPTGITNLDIVPANLSLAKAEKDVLLDAGGVPQQIRLREALRAVRDDYDYVIIDNAPSLGMAVINALATSDKLIIPVKVDKFTFDGVDTMLEQAERVQQYFNPQLRFMGTLVTSYRCNDLNRQGAEWLQQAAVYKVFDTRIRWTEKVDESTFSSEPVMIHSPRCGAAKDYKAFVNELLAMLSDSDTREGE